MSVEEQRDVVLAHLKTHGSITWNEARELYDIYRLNLIMHYVRRLGYIVGREKTEDTYIYTLKGEKHDTV